MHHRMSADVNNPDEDPQKTLTVYRNLQPCPLRSTIGMVKVQQSIQKELEHNSGPDKSLTRRKLDLIGDFI